MKYEIDGINKNNIKTYKKAFLDEKTSIGDENLKEYMKEIKKVSYEVESVENISVMGLLDTIAVMGIQSKDIQDAKTLKVSLEAKTEDGEHATTVEFEVLRLMISGMHWVIYYTKQGKRRNERKMGQFCKKCGTPLRDAAEFCPSCGQKVEEADEKKTLVERSEK